MREKIFLFLWVLGCIVFYSSLNDHVISFVSPAFPLRPLLLFLLGVSLLLLFSKGSPVFLKHPLFVFPIPLLAISFFFLKKFPIGTFSSLVFQDDFTSLYAASLRTLRMLREGTLFGWDSRLLGGYYTVSDINFNLGLFLWPFYFFFGPPAGYHLFIFFLLMLFPFLVYAFSRSLGDEEEVSGFAFWLAGFFAISFFRNILLWGNIDNLLGMDLFLLLLISLKKSEKDPRAFFWLAFLLALLAYAHLAYFVYALLLVGFSLFFFVHRRHFFYFCIAGIIVFLAVLPYALQFLRYPGFFNMDTKYYQSSSVSLQGASIQSLQKMSDLAKGLSWFTTGYEGVHGGNYEAAVLLTVPFLLLLFWIRKKSRLLVGSIVLILFLLPLKTGAALLMKRTYFLLPVLLPLALARSLTMFPKRGSLSMLVLMPTLLLGTVGLPSQRAISHQPALESFFPALYRRLPSLDGHALFLETQAVWIETDSGQKGDIFPGPHVHMEMLLAQETGKRYLSHGKDGYPFSIYRKNCLMSGIWAGKFLNQYDVRDVNDFLKRWGVRYVIVWSKTANTFFSANPAFYETVWREPPWTIFRFKEADPRSIVLPTGEGEIISERYTEISLRLKGAHQNDEAVFRMNYFPAFRAICDGKALPIYPKRGQVAFRIPRDGDMTVVFHYPRDSFLAVLALPAFALLAFYLWRKK